MGQIVKQVSEHTTRYVWYPGDKKEWLRAAFAAILGAAAYAIAYVLIGRMLPAAVIGTSVTAAIVGMNFGRRDGRAIAEFVRAPEPFDDVQAKLLRRAAMARSGRMAWRRVVQAAGGAAAALLIVNLSPAGFAEKWLLPLVPAVVGALAHQMGVLVQRMGQKRTVGGPAKRIPAPAPHRVAETTSVEHIS
jgi:hypothetical protein